MQVRGYNLHPLGYIFINLPFIELVNRNNSVGYRSRLGGDYLMSLLLTEYYLSYLDKSFADLINDRVSESELLEEIGDRHYRKKL